MKIEIKHIETYNELISRTKVHDKWFETFMPKFSINYN